MPSILAGIVKNRGDRNCISLHFNGGLDAYRDNLHMAVVGTFGEDLEGLLQYRDLAGAEDDCQLV